MQNESNCPPSPPPSASMAQAREGETGMPHQKPCFQATHHQAVLGAFGPHCSNVHRTIISQQREAGCSL